MKVGPLSYVITVFPFLPPNSFRSESSGREMAAEVRRQFSEIWFFPGRIQVCSRYIIQMRTPHYHSSGFSAAFRTLTTLPCCLVGEQRHPVHARCDRIQRIFANRTPLSVERHTTYLVLSSTIQYQQLERCKQHPTARNTCTRCHKIVKKRAPGEDRAVTSEATVGCLNTAVIAVTQSDMDGLRPCIQPLLSNIEV